MNIVYVIVIGIVLAIGSFLIGGAYTIVPVSTPTAVGSFVLNRYTGNIWLCNTNSCREIPNYQPKPGAEPPGG